MALGSKGSIFLALAIFLLCVAFIIIKTWCLCINGAALNFWRHPIQVPSEGGDSMLPVVVPSGCISYQGMEQASIQSLPALRYEELIIDASSRETSECSICFTMFRRGEWLRPLPYCSHVFHLPCIDHWLRNSSTCPLCRTNVLHDFGVIRMERLEREGVNLESPLNYRLLDLGYMIHLSGEEEQWLF